ncbi:AraC family transcriptional regulator [Leptospira gomenensis]|uniref:AraC family transcriptional regulator n=1 Tax=Leptospira gomenensis TaxID=2484974 RepID=A0A5F1YH84_9LEPT|nr:helix-turn-helix domain-containing protein [Leptospira gomenensis]TGK35351.1 AraC family transcriptional regulator [Leptospira gomenensis]TGK38449.1 AraC family transcriptional regulator [Leptospira gomenensis]TGK42564.1 AraC family transcriptional regulator [Leptospira gomenensis]TGK55812.1 AraC family transcriptional regulator [Leptospira gomenensis]
MQDLITVGEVLSYSVFSDFNLLYAHATGVGTGIVMAISRLYESRNHEFNKAYATILLSVSIFLLFNNRMFFPQEIDPRPLQNPLFLGVYFGLVLYACFALLICNLYVLENLRNPWQYCKRQLPVLPITIAVSYLIPGTVFISLCDSLGILLMVFTLIWSVRTIQILGKQKLYYNFSFITFMICVSLILDLIGTIQNQTRLLLISELIPGIMIGYVSVLERIYPFLFQPSTNEKRIEEIVPPVSQTILSEDEEKIESESGRNILEGIELARIEERINAFLQVRGYADEELRLPDFASYLGLSTHQASYYLNKHMSLKFADFLNMNRIEDVKRNLKNRTNMNLLQIAFESGFNSASSFHRACVKFTGKSPREFRKWISTEE